MIIRARAPLRLGLAGGGTDVSPYCDVFGGKVLNVTIDRFAWTTIIKTHDENVIFRSEDLGLQTCLKFDSELGILPLHKATYLTMMEKFNAGKYIPLLISTSCEVPRGSGLGASSTIVVSMVKAYAELLGLTLDDYEIANLAVYIERERCGFQGGLQDQYAASFGGVNFFEFNGGQDVLVNSLRVKSWIINELEASILLYFTGISRESANIISDQSRSIDQGREHALESMHHLRDQAYEMKRCLLQGDFEGLIKFINSSWEEKKKSSSYISNPVIEKALKTAFDNGALAGKVSGAGGGGFLWLFVPPERKIKIALELKKLGGQTSECHFVEKGAESWIVK